MRRYLFLLFIIIPVAEIWLLVTVGAQIGALPLVFLILTTAFIGVQFLRQQGLSTIARAQSQMESGHMPATELLEGVLLIVAGAFLLTPGFFTDTVGFLLLWSKTRQQAARLGLRMMVNRGSFSMHGSSFSGSFGSGAHRPGSQQTRGDTFEGEFSAASDTDLDIKSKQDHRIIDNRESGFDADIRDDAREE